MEIKLKNVSYIYNENTPFSHKALNDVNIEFKEGKVYGLIGPSGSGKTTLLQLINGLLLPTKGEVHVGDYVLKKNLKLSNLNKLRFNVGLVFQFPEEQIFEPTVKQEIEFSMKYFKYKLQSIDKRVSEALSMVGLDDEYLSRNPFNLSNGEKRRVSIASIMVFNPEILMLDEPTVGLDYNGKKKLIELIKLLNYRYHKTIIISTHDVDMLYQIADNIIVLDKGEVIIDDDKYEVFKHQSLLEKHHIKVPKIVEFTSKAISEKGIKLGRFNDIKDLIKDIYRNV
jgi:energy-coupling factor transport system ATP-binding protein